MDPTKTAPFLLGEGADACLLLHGFTGSPWEVRPLAEALVKRGLTVSAPLLPGHGREPRDMMGATHQDWLEAAQGALLALGGHRRVFVGGLSMGALLALLLAERHPQRVSGLALLAPAMRFRGATMALLKAARRLPLLEWVHPWVKKASTDLEDEAERAQAPVLPEFPSARLKDLWALQELVGGALPRVRAPTLIAMAAKDRVVSLGGGRELARRLINAKPLRFVRLDQGRHQMARDRGRAALAAEVGEFFARL